MMDGWMDQLIYQSINVWMDGRMDQSINQSINQSMVYMGTRGAYGVYGAYGVMVYGVYVCSNIIKWGINAVVSYITLAVPIISTIYAIES